MNIKADLCNILSLQHEISKSHNFPYSLIHLDYNLFSLYHFLHINSSSKGVYFGRISSIVDSGLFTRHAVYNYLNRLIRLGLITVVVDARIETKNKYSIIVKRQANSSYFHRIPILGNLNAIDLNTGLIDLSLFTLDYELMAKLKRLKVLPTMYEQFLNIP